ncbi:hypothetical protein MALU111345_03725 [Marinicrinis lubricantis]
MNTLPKVLKWPLFILNAMLYLCFGILLGEDEEPETPFRSPQ